MGRTPACDKAGGRRLTGLPHWWACGMAAAIVRAAKATDFSVEFRSPCLS